ncbi:FAD-dependent oxidoreductase [Desulfopila inferna]|uniref:FAD-dependent oxidoreductase n=1 Tax=Desulfopila inferna TaxID=468528 RepID=UPI00196613F6|nr:FAD-dependent oxidoreductase [Desulfopila inferna]MBM9603998.1 CoB--CoM heterodisulfide reductase iron-sulfur subunit A family protein [Desulfopila inferna]
MQNTKELPTSNKVLVIGGGLGGIRTALDLAEAEKDVILVDKSYNIGGLMTQLDRTFPTNNCDLCTISPNLSESGRQKHIELQAMTTVLGISGEKGNFTASLQTRPRYINLEKCTACGECLKAFPECVRFTPGLDHRAPTCMRYPQAIPQAYSIDLEKCDDIKALVKVCPAGAIIPDDIGRNREVKCGAVVLAMGAELFDPSHLDYLAYSAQPDVVTSLEYERILSASGPTQGMLLRPSNNERPKKIAWLQCIGSRGIQKGAGSHCSSACCMFALKEAMVTKERFRDDIETTIFYMDMRTFGKDYELYYQRAKNDFGVRFIHSRPHSILQAEGEKDLHLSYTLEGNASQITESFDMVVLSTGFKVGEESRELLEKLGLKINSNNFPVTAGFNPVATSKPGIYVCGTLQEPKDIPETMVQASAAACMAGKDIAPSIADEDKEPLMPEKDISGEEPKVGVFICDCGENIGAVVDVEQLVEYAAGIPGVAVAEAKGHGCSRESMEQIKSTIIEQGLNRVVIAGCSPRTHEAKFQELIRQAGLNKYLLEMANIRDQSTWVHGAEPALATGKSKDLIRVAVGGAIASKPLSEHSLPMNKNILVVGGGVTGMTTALELAGQGFKVYLAEKSPSLGGVAKSLRKTLEGDDVQALVADLIAQTEAHESIEVITGAIIVDHTGMPGMFKTGMQVGKQMFYRQIEHGVTVMATGALPNRPKQYLLGENDNVLTQLEIQTLIEDKPETVKTWDNVVMIQCVGSRNEENPNCSRICCQNAVKNALRLVETNPDIRVFVLYRDMRTYGFQEEYYQKAREKGVIFVRYDSDAPPTVKEAGKIIEVSFTDPILGMNLTVAADCLCLSTGLIADKDSTEELAQVFKLQRTGDGYFLEDHVKLRPVDLAMPGFYVAGTAHSPRSIRESLVQARAAASRAQALLARDFINLGAASAKVDGNKCAACLICVRACPFGIPFINAEGYSEIDPAQCHGCGLCASECPAKAIQLMQFEDDRILAKIEDLFERLEAKA